MIEPMRDEPQSEPDLGSLDALMERDRARLGRSVRRMRVLLAVVTVLLTVRFVWVVVLAGGLAWGDASSGALVVILLGLNWVFWRRRRDRNTPLAREQ
jgi:Na+(H+)/acetate symporter ActP